MSDENEPSWLAEATNPINPSSCRREEDPNSPSWAFTHKDKFVRKQLPPGENVDDHNPSWVREPSAVGHSSSSSGFRRGSPEGEGDEHCCCQYCYDCEHSIEGCCCGPTDPLLWWFHIISFFAGATALASMGASVKLLYSEGITIRNLMLRGYSVLFCTIALTLELDIKFFVSRLAALDIWFFRGLFYIFIGLITIDDEFVNLNTSDIADIIGIIQMFFGLLYIVMGLLCLKSVKKRRQEIARVVSQYVELTNNSPSGHASV